MTKRKKENFKPLRNCEFCGKEFQLNRAWQKYCSRECNQNAFYTNRAEKLKSDTGNIEALLDPYTQSERQRAEIERRKELPSQTPEEQKNKIKTLEEIHRRENILENMMNFKKEDKSS